MITVTVKIRAWDAFAKEGQASLGASALNPSRAITPSSRPHLTRTRYTPPIVHILSVSVLFVVFPFKVAPTEPIDNNARRGSGRIMNTAAVTLVVWNGSEEST